MHVLIIVENLPVPFDRRVWLEATSLREAGHRVTVICPLRGDLAAEETLDGVRILRHPLPEADGGAWGYVTEYRQAIAWETRLAWRVWREDPFDVVHLCNPPDLLFLVALPFKLRFGVRIVFDHHDLGPELYRVKFGRHDAAYWALRVAERITFAAADAVIATNESYAEVARSRGGKRNEHVHVVRSGPDLARFQRRPRPAADAPFTIGYVGVIAEQDGVDLLVRTVAELERLTNMLPYRVVIVGDGPSRVEVERLAQELRVSDRFDFRGYLTGKALLDALSTFDIGVCPDPANGYNEHCTMNKVLEYMALGIPVAQFDLCESRRSAGEAAIYARPSEPAALAEAIATLAVDPIRRAAMGKVGRRRMDESLEWRHQAPHLLAAYASLATPSST